TFAFVWFWRVKTANVCRHLAHQFFVHTFDANLGSISESYLEFLWNLKMNRVRETEAQIECRALHRGLETDALDLELLGKALADALHHVVNQAAGESLHTLPRARFRFAHNE